MNFEYLKENRTLSLKIEGEIDHHSCEQIKKEVDYEIQKYSPKKLIFDFKDVNFMDSSGIGLIIGRYKYLLRIGGKTEIINASKDVKRILDMSGIFKIIPIFEEVKA
ncbi:MAG: anti-sigma F factor antagonist [Clostridia bacterium]|nr:anti-sigma F factor antagonist [Clostridia bacterium]